MIKKMVCILLCSLALFSSPTQANNATLYRIPSAKSCVALTFNLEWGDLIYKDVLRVLAEHNAHATFFVSGSWAERHPDELRSIARAGHDIGTIGYRPSKTNPNKEQDVTHDFIRAVDVLKKLGIKRIAFYRSYPNHARQTHIHTANLYHVTLVAHSVASNDENLPGAKQIANNTIQTTGGDIVNFSASDRAIQTPQALHVVLHRFEAKKLQIKSLSDCIGDGDVKTKLLN
ncbi:MAG: polysaccharide deacetylase family protein [Bacilli bacterium]